MKDKQIATGDSIVQVNRSKGVHVTIINSNGILEKIHDNMKKFDFISLADNINSVRRMTNVSDDYDIFFDIQKPNSLRIVPKNKNKKEIIRGRCIFELSNEFSGFNTFSEIAKYSYLKQKDIRLNVISYEIKIGNKTIQTFKSDYKGNGPYGIFDFSTNAEIEVFVGEEKSDLRKSELTIIPSEFPPPFFVNIENENYQTLCPSIQFRLEEISEFSNMVTFVLSNKEQTDNPILIKLIMTVSNCDGNHTGSHTVISNKMKFELRHQSTYHNFIYYKLLNDLRKSKEIIFRDIESAKVFAWGKSFRIFEDVDIESQFRLWENILCLEKEFKIGFTIPEEIPNSECQKVHDLYNIIKSGIISYRKKGKMSFSMKPVNNLEEFVRKAKEKNITLVIQQNNVEIDIFGQTVNLGEKYSIYQKLTLENISELERYAHEESINEEIQLRFQLEENGIEKNIYPRYYGINKLKEIMEKECIDSSGLLIKIEIKS